MSEIIMVGCDLHDRSMLLRYATGLGEPQQMTCSNTAEGRERMIKKLLSHRDQHQAAKCVFAYEASGLGFGLADELELNGIECHVLSPTHLPKTPKGAKQKTDVRDAQMLLEQLRGHVLAGNALPTVWTPPHRLRDDRELVRARIDAGEELTRVKLKVLSLLKRRGISLPENYQCKWSKAFVRWLHETAAVLCDETRVVVEQLANRYELYRKEIGSLDKAIRTLSQQPRYKVPHRTLREIPGVGLLVAMAFLTEMGDLLRFENRRQIAAFLGVCPSCRESGEVPDRKGRITRQGPSRLRKLLCQAVWVSLKYCDKARADHERIKQGQAKRSKKATVALMRKLAIRMWHAGVSCGVSTELCGRGGPAQTNASVV